MFFRFCLFSVNETWVFKSLDDGPEIRDHRAYEMDDAKDDEGVSHEDETGFTSEDAFAIENLEVFRGSASEHGVADKVNANDGNGPPHDPSVLLCGNDSRRNEEDDKADDEGI